MKQGVFLYILVSLTCLMGVEVPVRDLSKESGDTVQPSIPVRRAQPVQVVSQETQTPKSDAKLELALREIQILRKAAQSVGGDLEVIIRPKGGITAEDLILPLSKTGAFEIKPGKAPGSVRIESRGLESTPAPESSGKSSSPSTSPVPTIILKPGSLSSTSNPLP